MRSETCSRIFVKNNKNVQRELTRYKLLERAVKNKYVGIPKTTMHTENMGTKRDIKFFPDNWQKIKIK